MKWASTLNSSPQVRKRDKETWSRKKKVSWNEGGGESRDARVTARKESEAGCSHFRPEACAFLVLILWARQSQPSTCMHFQVPATLQSSRPLAPANSLFYSPVGGPVTAIQSRPGILEPQGPRTCHDKCQAEIFSLRHCQKVCLPLTLCHLTVKHSHKNAHCSGQKTPLCFILICTPLYFLIFNVED